MHSIEPLILFITKQLTSKHIFCGTDLYSVTEAVQKTRTRQSLDNYFGILAGLLIASSGHRTGVLTNLTVQEVVEAVESEDGVVIYASIHIQYRGVCVHDIIVASAHVFNFTGEGTQDQEVFWPCLNWD